MGKAARAPFEWEEVYSSWLAAEARYAPPGLPAGGFRRIASIAPDRRFGIEWWHWGDVARFDEGAEHPAARPLPRARCLSRGAEHTLRMLWEAREDAPLSAAVWLGAFLQQHGGRYTPSAWRGEQHVLLQALVPAVRKTLAPIETWHHAMRALLPVTYVDDELAQTTTLRSLGGVTRLAMLNAVLNQTVWVPVELPPVEGRPAGRWKPSELDRAWARSVLKRHGLR